MTLALRRRAPASNDAENVGLAGPGRIDGQWVRVLGARRPSGPAAGG